MNRVSNWIINSKEFFWIALSMMILITSLTILLYLLNVYEVNGLYFNELKGGMEEFDLWARIILTSAGSTLAVLSLLLVNRHNKNFFYFGVTSTILLTLNGFLSHLFFDAIKWMCVGVVLSTQAIIWNVRSNKEVNFKSINILPLVGIIAAITIIATIAGIGVSFIPEDSLFYNKKPILDPVQFAFTIVGNILIMLYFIESRIIYMIGNIITLFMFTLIIGQGELLSLIQLVQGGLYLTITISGYITMKEMKKNKDKASTDESIVEIGDYCCLISY